jgi:hypothetical protein
MGLFRGRIGCQKQPTSLNNINGMAAVKRR